MQRFYAEVNIDQLSKQGEELCGDNVEVVRTDNSTIIVLSDGLGSGVKANILAMLTTKIASSMLKRGIPLEEVVNTIAQTLPVCRQRKIAYSTFHIIKINDTGLTNVIEFDCPPTFLLRDQHVLPFPSQEKTIAGKIVKEGQLLLQENDKLVLVSDGVIHAGIGGLLKLGWGWEGVEQELQNANQNGSDAEQIGQHIINCCQGYYLDRPGDDSTVVVVKLRPQRKLTLFIGPPANPAIDEQITKNFLDRPGKKVVAGGTTAHIISRITGKPITTELNYDDPQIPPIGHIEGIDLVTEGVLTVNAAVERLIHPKLLKRSKRQDGATLLAKMLLDADKITFFIGTAINPAHQNPSFPAQLNIKSQVLTKMQEVLLDLNKQVDIEWL
ncbi:MAG: stage sporulation protein [Firmicutes bacterium]|nr:stage sporulation protein [Bacillota bacterium]